MHKLLHMFSSIFRHESLMLYASRGTAIGLQSISFLLIARLIGIESFGVFSFSYSLSQVICVLVGAGGYQLIDRRLPANDATLKGQGNYSLFLSVVVRLTTLTLLVLFAVKAFLFLLPELIPPIYASILVIAVATGFSIQLLYVCTSVVRIAHNATTSILLRDCIPFLLFLSGTFLCQEILVESVDIFLMIFCASCSICSLVSFLMVRRYFSKEQRHGHAASKLNIFDKECLGFWGVDAVGSTLFQIDILIARALLNDAELGLYAILRRVSNLISIPQTIANISINVKVAADFALNQKEMLRAHALNGLKIATPMASALFLLILLMLPFWIGFFGATASWQVFFLLLILCSSQLYNVFSGANTLFASQCHLEHYVLFSRIVSLTIGAASMAIGAHFLGTTGVALGTLLCNVVLNSMITLEVKRKVDVWTCIRIRQIPFLIQLK